MTTEEVGKHILQQRCMDVEKDLIPNFGNWEVKADGDLLYHGSEIAIKEIPAMELESEHLTHMLSKFRESKSKDAADFYFSYLHALKHAGYKSITIDLSHIHNIKFEK